MSLAGSPRYQRYGGTNRVNRSVVTGIADDSVDDLLFRTRMAATAHNPHASSLHQAAAEVYALTGSTMYSDRLRITPPHASFADAYESLRLGDPPPVIEEMLRHQPALARQSDTNGCSLLHWACYYGSDPAVFETLLRLNPRAARRPSKNDGCLPMHVAASWGCSVPTVALLFSAFPEAVSCADVWGNLPVDKALQMGHAAIVPLLTPLGDERAHPSPGSPPQGRSAVHRPSLSVDEPSLASAGFAEEESPGGGPGAAQSWRRPASAEARLSGGGGGGDGGSGDGDEEGRRLRHQLTVQRSMLEHRMARLEHSDSIASAEVASVSGALSAERRRNERLQQQVDELTAALAAAKPRPRAPHRT